MLVARYKKYFINSIVGTSCSGRATLSGVSPVADLERYLGGGGYIQGRREGGAKYLGPRLVWGPEIFIKHLVIGLLSRGFGARNV